MSDDSTTTDAGRVPTNKYRDFDTGVAMYDGNPLIGALGPILDEAQTLAFLTKSNPKYRPSERAKPTHLRTHYVRVIGEHYTPTLAQLAVFEEMQVYLRQGYRHRNPLDPEFRAVFLEDRKRAARGLMPPERYQHIPLLGTAAVGGAGLGKTSAFLHSAAYYPVCIEHLYEIQGSVRSFLQVPILKLDLQPNASTKDLGIEFFDKLGAVVGCDLRSEWGVNSCSENSIQPKIYLACRDYNVGMIIVDEVQNMSGSQTKENRVLSYFVRLMNTIGVPIALIGTETLGSMIQTALAMGRRFTGTIPRFEPFRPGPLWDEFLTQICSYEYTRERNNLARHSGLIWELTAGVPDLVVKLVTFAQVRAFGQKSEIIDKRALNETAAVLFHLVNDRIMQIKAGVKGSLDEQRALANLKKRYEELMNERSTMLGAPPPYSDVADRAIEIGPESAALPDAVLDITTAPELPLAMPALPAITERSPAKSKRMTPSDAVARLKQLGMIRGAAA